MKKNSIFSALIGGAFFAIPYLALDIALFPSAVIAVAAYGAGSLMLKEPEEVTKVVLEDKSGQSIDKIISDAKVLNGQIYAMMNRVEDKDLINSIREIHETSKKIIDTIEKNPKKLKHANNFFSYYLPSTLNFLKKYDEIENQKLVTDEAKAFMDNAEEMMVKIKESFKVQLANLYKSDIMGTDAEMKVFDTMLKSDGIDATSDFDLK